MESPLPTATSHRTPSAANSVASSAVLTSPLAPVSPPPPPPPVPTTTTTAVEENNQHIVDISPLRAPMGPLPSSNAALLSPARDGSPAGANNNNMASAAPYGTTATALTYPAPDVEPTTTHNAVPAPTAYSHQPIVEITTLEDPFSVGDAGSGVPPAAPYMNGVHHGAPTNTTNENISNAQQQLQAAQQQAHQHQHQQVPQAAQQTPQRTSPRRFDTTKSLVSPMERPDDRHVGPLVSRGAPTTEMVSQQIDWAKTAIRSGAVHSVRLDRVVHGIVDGDGTPSKAKKASDLRKPRNKPVERKTYLY